MAYHLESPVRVTKLSMDDCHPPQNECCGWLWMRTSRIRSWKYRYFSLRDAVLSYYDKFPSEDYFSEKITTSYLHNDGTHPKGVIRVAHIEETPGNSLGFKVFGTSGKSIDIRAAKANIRSIWIRALSPAAERRSRAWSISGSVVDSTESTGTVSMDYEEAAFEHHRATTSPVLKCGWMLKRSDILKQWRRYYFVLQGDMVSYYMTDKPYEVPRRRGYVIHAARSTKANGGLVLSLNSGASLYVTAEDRLENEMWYGMFEASIKQRKRKEQRDSRFSDFLEEIESDTD